MHIDKHLPNIVRVRGNRIMTEHFPTVPIPAAVCHQLRHPLRCLRRDIHQLLPNKAPRPVHLIKRIPVMGRQPKVLILRKVIPNPATSLNLLREHVLLVEEHNDAGLVEKAIVPDTTEQLKRFTQAVLGVILTECLVKVAAGDHEEDSLDAFENLQPFVAVIALTTDIEHAEDVVAAAHFCGRFYGEGDFGDAGGGLAAAEDVFVGW